MEDMGFDVGGAAATCKPNRRTGTMNQEERTHVYRGMIAELAVALYNREQIGHEQDVVAEALRLDDRPDRLTREQVDAAMDAIFENASI